MEERRLCKPDVAGSTPVDSTKMFLVLRNDEGCDVVVRVIAEEDKYAETVTADIFHAIKRDKPGKDTQFYKDETMRLWPRESMRYKLERL